MGVQYGQPFPAIFFQVSPVESKNPDGHPSPFRQRLARRASKSDVLPGFFACGIDQERLFRINVVMMVSSSCL